MKDTPMLKEEDWEEYLKHLSRQRLISILYKGLLPNYQNKQSKRKMPWNTMQL